MPGQLTYAELIQPVLWLIAGGASVFFSARALLAWRRKAPSRSIRGAVIALLAAFVVVPAIGVVPAGHRGVVYSWTGGVSPSERGEGVTLLIPWLQHLTKTSVRTQKVFSSKVFAQSLDLQEITVVASVNYHVRPDYAAELYQEVGPQYQSTVIQPALFQRTKAAVGLVKAENFASSRSGLATTVQEQLESQLAGYGIVVEYVNIEDAIFDPAFVKAVKRKVIAEQKAMEQENLIAAQAAIKQQTIIKAQATAQAIQIEATAQAKANLKIAASVTPALLRWRWLVVWNGMLPSTLVGDSGQVSLFLPTGESYGGYTP